MSFKLIVGIVFMYLLGTVMLGLTQGWYMINSATNAISGITGAGFGNNPLSVGSIISTLFSGGFFQSLFNVATLNFPVLTANPDLRILQFIFILPISTGVIYLIITSFISLLQGFVP